MFRVLALLLLLAAPAVAQVGQGYSPAPGLSATGDASTTTSLATGGTASPATTNAARFAQRIDVKADFGATGDTQSINTFTVTVNASGTAVTLTGGSYSSADVGKRMIIDGAGPLRTLGYVASVPVTAAGSAYTTTPTVAFSGLSTASGVVGVAQMAAQSASVVSGGTGCPASSPITLTLTGGTGTSAQVSGTTNGSGVLTGALTVAAPGSYTPGTATTTLLALAAVPTTSGSTCSTYPTVLPSWGIGSILMAGVGANVPLNGVSASLSTGSATLGTPVVSQVVTPLSGLILSVQDAQHVTLDTPATTALSAQVVTVTWGHDDAPAFAAAKARSDTVFAATGVSPCLYASAGNYLISTRVPTFFQNPGCIIGDGADRTNFKLDAGETGPLFSWSEAWFGGGAYPAGGPTAALSINYVGPIANGFSVTGDITVAAEQDALVLYDRNDRVKFHDIKANYLWGRLAYTGVLLNKTQSYIRESYWSDVYGAHSGAPFAPLFEISQIDSLAGSDSTNTNVFVGLQGWDLGGQGLVLRSQSPTTNKLQTEEDFYFTRMEGGVATVAQDQYQIGDGTFTGPVAIVNMFGVSAIAGNYGANAFTVNAPALASQSTRLSVYGLAVDANSGAGINVAAGSRIKFDITAMSSIATNVIIGPSTLVTVPIGIDGHGFEKNYTYAIDTTSAGATLTPVFRSGDPSNPGGASGGGVTGIVHDGSIAGGNALPLGATDLQTVRTAAAQVAGAQLSTISGGRLNQINSSGIGATICGGSATTLNGAYSHGCGNSAGDHSVSGLDIYADGQFAGVGDAQIFRGVMRGTGSSTSAIRLTADGGAAGATNCLNLLDNYSASFSITVHVRDATTAGNDYSWVVPNAMMTRDTGAASVLLSLGTPLILSRGTTPTVAATADTTNGCINISATPAGGNTHTLHAVAEINGAMVH